MDENNQQNAKIYKITNNRGDVYIGRTSLSLLHRLRKHKSFFKQYKKATDANIYIKKISSVKIFENLEENEKAVIELIEEFPYNNMQQLREREGYHIREHLEYNNCVNIKIAGRTGKQFYKDNLNLYQLKNSTYYQNNKERLKQKRLNRINEAINIEAL